MDIKGLSTEFLEEIVVNYDNIKEEIKKRKKRGKEFRFNKGDIIFKKDKYNNHFFLHIKEIDKNNDNVICDEIELRNDGTFIMYEEELFSYEDTKWNKYKVVNSSIYSTLEGLINEYSKHVDLLTESTYKDLQTIIKQI